jgi:hypothetical protein
MSDTIKTRLEQLLKSLDKTTPDSLKLSLSNAHKKGLFSLVISGVAPGNLQRVFIADKKVSPYDIQLHTHRYPIRITVLKGTVKHYVAKKGTSEQCRVRLSEFEYSSPLTGGKGLAYLHEDYFDIQEYILPVGSMTSLGVADYHTISCSKGAVWVVEEMGYRCEVSKVLGIPFNTSGLYTQPERFEPHNRHIQVTKTVEKLIKRFDAV